MIGQPSTQFDTGHGVEMVAKRGIASANLAFRGAQGGQAKLGFAESAADINNVARPSTGSKQGSPTSYLADDRYINKHAVLPSRVATGDGAPQFVGSAAQASEKIIQPADGEFVRNRQAQ
jgi:hypothetical protein